MTIIRNGVVYDPAQGETAVRRSIFIRDGVFVAPSSSSSSFYSSSSSSPSGNDDDDDVRDNDEEAVIFDAEGAFVCPGFVDAHAHVMEHATPLGVSPDQHCLKHGVTTVVDAGSTGALTFPGLKHYVIAKAKTRVFALLHIACHGLSGAGCSGPDFDVGGESDHLNAIKPKLCAKVARENPDSVVGLKVRLDKSITDGGRIEEQVFHGSCEGAAMADLPLMVHHTFSGIEMGMSSPESPGLKPGDIYTHCFSAFAGKNAESIVDASSKTVRPWAQRWRKRRSAPVFCRTRSVPIFTAPVCLTKMPREEAKELRVYPMSWPSSWHWDSVWKR